MPKGMAETVEVATAAAKLRDMIRRLELGAADLEGRGEGVLGLLKLRDEVEAEMSRLREQGLDLRAEGTRIATVDNILMRKAGSLGHELRSLGGLAGARRQENPPEEHWWWYVDLYLAERQRKKLIRSLGVILGVVLLLLAGNYVLNRFFGLSPIEKEARAHTGQAERHLLNEDYPAAISQLEQAVALQPSLFDAQATLGVLYEMQGRAEEAQAAFAAAETAAQSRLEYLFALARAYQSVNKPDEATARIEEAILLSPESSQAYLMRGSLYEAADKTSEAIEDYEKAADLAQAQGQDALYVLARTRMGMLLQRAPSMGFPGGGF